MSDRSAVAELLADLSDALGTRRWYVFGAQAVTVLGLPRMTADVDVTVEAGESGSPGDHRSRSC